MTIQPRRRPEFLFCACLLLATVNGIAADWPQWGGVNRNFHIPDIQLSDDWPAGGFKPVWHQSIGDGFAGVAVVGQRCFVSYRRDDHEYVSAFRSDSGEELWTHRYPAPFLDGTDLEPGPGPHATPLVVGDRLVTVGVTGLVHCRNVETGDLLWSHDVIHDFNGTILYRGFSCNPLQHGDSVILTVGGI